MEAKDIKAHRKELLEIGHKVNDFSAAFALHFHDERNLLPDIFKVTEDIFEITFKAVYKHALEGAVMEGAYESIKKAGAKEERERIFPSGYHPNHLLSWADQLDTEFGYKDSTIVCFLRQLAANWQALKEGK